MKICRILRNVHQRVIHLIINYPRDLAAVLQRNPCILSKRHRPEAVHAAIRIDRDHRGIQLHEVRIKNISVVRSPRRGKEIAQRAFNARILLIVPVHPNDHIAPDIAGHPHTLNRTAALNLRHRKRLSGLNGIRRRNLPSPAELSRAARAGALRRKSAGIDLSTIVFRTDRPGFRIRQQRQRRRTELKFMKHTLISLRYFL